MTQLAPDRVDAPLPNSNDGRTALAKLVVNLFDRWKLATSDQAAMLGLSEHSRATLASYRSGRPLADSRDLLETPVATNASSTNGIFLLNDPGLTNYPYRFYRGKVP